MNRLRIVLPLVLALLLTACGGTGTPPPTEVPPNFETLAVSGVLTGATATTITPTDTNGYVIGQAGPVDTAESFRVVLEPPAYFEPFNPAAECRGGAITNTLALSTYTARITDAFFKPSGGTATTLRLIDSSIPGRLRLVRHQYVSENVTAQGQVQCADGFNPLLSFQVELVKGWNRVLSELTLVGGDITAITYTVLPAETTPEGISWVAE